MIVVMTANVDVADGLTNGATGVIKTLITEWKEQIVLILFGFCLIILELVGQQERNTEPYIIRVSKENGLLSLMYKEHLY